MDTLETESKSEHHICDYHKLHPEDRSYPGCTCYGSFTVMKVTDAPKHCGRCHFPIKACRCPE